MVVLISIPLTPVLHQPREIGRQLTDSRQFAENFKVVEKNLESLHSKQGCNIGFLYGYSNTYIGGVMVNSILLHCTLCKLE